MKKGYIVLLAISLGLTFISFILMFLPSFYNTYSSSTMYISGYGSSTSKSSGSNLGLFDASVFLGVVCILFTLASFPMLVLSLVLGAVEKPRFMIFLFLGFVFTLVPGFATFFAQFTLGSSNTNGVAGAWHSTSEHVQFGAAGGWFTALKIITYLLVAIAIVVGAKMRSEFVYRPAVKTPAPTPTPSIPKVVLQENDCVKLVTSVSTASGGSIPTNTKGEIISRREDGKFIVKLNLSDGTTKTIAADSNILLKDDNPYSVAISANDKEVPLDIEYDFDHINQEANYCSRCGLHGFVKYPNYMVCYNCRKVFSFDEYNQLPAYQKDGVKKWVYYPDVLNKYKKAVSETTSLKMKQMFNIDKNEYYDFIDKNYIEIQSGSKRLQDTDAEGFSAIFGEKYFLLIPSLSQNDLELLSDPFGSLKKYLHRFDCIEKCQYVTTTRTHLEQKAIDESNPKYLKYTLDSLNNVVENHYIVHLKGIPWISYMKIALYEPILNALKNSNVPIIKEQDESLIKFEKKYGIPWSEFQRNSLGVHSSVGHDTISSSTFYFVALVNETDSLFIVSKSVDDEGYKAAVNRALPDMKELEQYLFTPKDIDDVKVKHDHFSNTIHHKASMGDMILGDLAFGEAGMLAAAVSNNYDTTLTSDYYHLLVTFKSNRLNGITLSFTSTNSSGNGQLWDFFLKYKDIGTLRARNEMLKELDEPEESKETTQLKPVFSAADEIKKYKELLDCGAITQEEYEAKKKELLNM